MKHSMQMRKTRPKALFVVVGGLLLLVSYLVTPDDKLSEFWTSTLQNLALIALTVVILDSLWSIVGGDPAAEAIAELQQLLGRIQESIKLLDDSQKTGVLRVLADSGSWGTNNDWMARLASANLKVDLMGYTLHVLTRSQNFEAVMTALVKRGVQIRLVVMAPDNPQLSAFINEAQIAGLSVAAAVEELKAATKAFRSLATALNSPNFQFHLLHAGLVATQIVRVDEKITSIQYLYSVVASRSPLLEAHGESSELFRCYSTEFERVWALSRTA